MLNLDLKKVEAAIAAGRLDEAFGLLKSSKHINHARGQQLKDDLMNMLLVRAEQHLELQHYCDARDDVRMAKQLGGRQTQIVKLLKRIDEESPFRKNVGHDEPVNRVNRRDRKESNRTVGSILQVDQIGSLLLMSGEHVSIGTTETRGAIDIVLQTQGQTEAIYLRRSGEDYLASCGCEFHVNGKSVRECLLADGDSIEVGNRGRLTFRRPVAASGTSILEIKGSKMERRDVRKIVLMGDALIFGNSGSHFYAGAAKPIMVRETEDAQEEFIVHEKGDSLHQKLLVGNSVSVGSIRFSLTPVLQRSR